MHNAATDHHIRNMYQIVAPLKGPKGFQNAFYNYNDYIAKPGPVVIPSNSAKPELAMAWFDSCYDVEVSFRQRYGEKGVDWDIPGPTEKAVAAAPHLQGHHKPMELPTYRTGSPRDLRWPDRISWRFPSRPRSQDRAEIHDLEKFLYDATALYRNM
jgi:hypothetical protein